VAGWTFIVWGLAHGVLVLVNHLWKKRVPGGLPALAGWALTFPAVVTLWVLFRATSVAVAGKIITAMWSPGPLTSGGIAEINAPYVAFVIPNVVLAAALLMPNSTQLAHRLRHGRLRSAASPAPGRWWMPAAVTGAALYMAITSIGNVQSKFIYFNF
jgi:alginate O-acetyltransferase complex protein AlgI